MLAVADPTLAILRYTHAHPTIGALLPVLFLLSALDAFPGVSPKTPDWTRPIVRLALLLIFAAGVVAPLSPPLMGPELVSLARRGMLVVGFATLLGVWFVSLLGVLAIGAALIAMAVPRLVIPRAKAFWADRVAELRDAREEGERKRRNRHADS